MDNNCKNHSKRTRSVYKKSFTNLQIHVLQMYVYKYINNAYKVKVYIIHYNKKSLFNQTQAFKDWMELNC